tara:strand:+ start:259 stop:498 length:240 start_codon:yes stop_codon:yes gene_type:complete
MGSIDINELKIKYKYNNKKIFIVILLVHDHSFLIKKNNIIKISKTNILINEIDGPIKKLSGKIDNKISKYLLKCTSLIF